MKLAILSKPIVIAALILAGGSAQAGQVQELLPQASSAIQAIVPYPLEHLLLGRSRD